MKRVAALEFAHESNTFSVLPTEMRDFRAGHYLVGDQMRPALSNTNSEIGGFISAQESLGWEPVFILAAHATPGGKVSEAARREITDQALGRLKDAMPLDGVFIGLHGAMVTETSDDGEGQFLREIRKVVGDDIPIAVTFDLHANIFDDTADLVDIAISYRTYPHVDMAERAREACDLLDQTMHGKIAPVITIARPPMLVGCDEGRTTNDGPMCRILEVAQREAARPGILNVSINVGFNEADVFATGPSIIVGYDRKCAQLSDTQDIETTLIHEIWKWRGIFDHPISLAESMAQLEQIPQGKGPIVIADYSDNPGSGAYGDCTAIIGALLDRNVENAAAGALWDPVAAAQLIKAGIGETVTLSIGGKTDALVGGGPLIVTGKVTAISDGILTYQGPMYAGMTASLGASACLRVDGLDIIIASERLQMLDQNIFRALGIEPTEKAILVVKSMQHFRSSFGPIAREIISADGGGLSTPNVHGRDHRRVRRPVLPLDSEKDCAKLLP